MKSKVKILMKERGVTVRKLREEHGLNFQTVTNAGDDRKIRKCQLGTLEKIAHALGCRVKDLFDEE